MNNPRALCELAAMGPNSREFMENLIDADLSNEAFPFATAQEINVAGKLFPIKIHLEPMVDSKSERSRM